MSGPADWNASEYHRLAAPQEDWARELLERLPLAGDERVLDAGCGSGRVTRLLLERLPRGSVVGVDGSPSMLAEARANLAEWGERVELVRSDLSELALTSPADAAFSNATFHWIADHGKLFRSLRRSLADGARLVAQCGGEGNVRSYREAIESAAAQPRFAAAFAGWPGPWNFAGVEATEAHLRAAGFTEIRCWLQEKTFEPEDPRAYIDAVGLAPHHERLPEAERAAFTDAVLAELPDPLRLDYVRLNIEAVAA